jgi:DNA-binding transcriptional ArsR family regulator
MFVSTRDQVKDLLGEGLARSEVARRLGVSKATVSYHARRLGFPVQSPRRYDWAAVQAFYDSGHTVRECQTQFGFHSAAWSEAVSRGELVSRPRAMPIDTLLTGTRCRTHIKQRLLGAGLLFERCEQCGITDWRGRRLALELHHRNGNGRDNRLENLTLLCPNCHSQTDSWGGRNNKS